MTPDQLFLTVDKDRSGSLSHAEFKSTLDHIGVELSYDEIQALIHTLDANNDGDINHIEFTAIMERFGIRGLNTIQKCIIQVADMIEKSKVTLRQAFQIMDKDRSGLLDRNELRNSFNKMNIRMSDSDLTAFIDHVAGPGRSQIDADDFSKTFIIELEKISHLRHKDDI